MREFKNVTERVEFLKEYLLKTYPEGKFKANSSSFIDVIQINSNNIYYIKLLIEEGFIKCTKRAERIQGEAGNRWSLTEYEIPSLLKKNEVKDNKMNVNDCIDEKFNDIPMRLYKTEKGYVVPISCISEALCLEPQVLHQLLSNYKELFESWRINVILKGKKATTKNTCLTRDGVIGLLMKLSYNRLQPKQKKLVLEFQKWSIEKLGELISKGKIELSEQEHAKVQNNISIITNITEEVMDIMFNDLKGIIDEKLLKVKSIIKDKEIEVNRAKAERDNAIQREKLTLAKVPKMVEQRINLLLNV